MRAGAEERGHLAGALAIRSTATTRTREKLGRRERNKYPNLSVSSCLLTSCETLRLPEPNKSQKVKGTGAQSPGFKLLMQEQGGKEERMDQGTKRSRVEPRVQRP